MVVLAGWHWLGLHKVIVLTVMGGDASRLMLEHSTATFNMCVPSCVPVTYEHSVCLGHAERSSSSVGDQPVCREVTLTNIPPHESYNASISRPKIVLSTMLCRLCQLTATEPHNNVAAEAKGCS